ncbi:hypothetical protein Ari01nite_29350 [Paractinoplanes rishiriensis]|uniref:Uncharacterized protein n=1 Tax=Paractinoplanes rishiriensis TaxID=1050105 RepID=A0A919JXS6_9ACTN|nr:hypothetical protein Ari01nite_29350 [Actinoplanes rishiriensis]
MRSGRLWSGWLLRVAEAFGYVVEAVALALFQALGSATLVVSAEFFACWGIVAGCGVVAHLG